MVFRRYVGHGIWFGLDKNSEYTVKHAPMFERVLDLPMAQFVVDENVEVQRMIMSYRDRKVVTEEKVTGKALVFIRSSCTWVSMEGFDMRSGKYATPKCARWSCSMYPQDNSRW